MRILLDECVPARLRRAFPGHAVLTVTEAGWRGVKDGPLLRLAEERFDVLVSVDRRLAEQHRLEDFRLGFVFARVRDNRLSSFEPIFEVLREAVERAGPGETIWVGAPRR